MILLDTCVMIFDALAPEQLSKPATSELDKGRENGNLACSDISRWEIAMLMKKERIKSDMPPRDFLTDVIAANRLRVLPITPEIAWLANFSFIQSLNCSLIRGAAQAEAKKAII